MKDKSLYELTVDNKQLVILNKALSDYICWQHEGIDLDVVDVPTTIENIKVAQDMKAVINYQLGKTRHTPKQTSNTSLMFCKEIDLEDCSAMTENQLDLLCERHLSKNIHISNSDNLDSTVEFNQEKIAKDLSEPKFLITSTGETVTVDDIFASFSYNPSQPPSPPERK